VRGEGGGGVEEPGHVSCLIHIWHTLLANQISRFNSNIVN
jgi:hypothetical protein